MALYKQTEPQFEKLAMLTKLSENMDSWLGEVTNEAYNQLPFIAGMEVAVDLQRTNTDNKSALGVLKVASPSGKKLVIFPLIIKQAQMYPLDVMIMDGKAVPATSREINKYVFDPSIFKTTTPKDKAGMDKAIDPSVFPFGLQQSAGGGVAQPGKFASTIDLDNYNKVKEIVESDPFFKKYLGKKLESFRPPVIEKQAEAMTPQLDSLVIYTTDDGVAAVGVSLDPFAIYSYKNAELEKAAEELLVDKDVVMIGNGQGLQTLEDMVVKTGTVNIPGTGEGVYFEHMVDIFGKAHDQKLFIGSKHFSIQEKVAGSQINDNIGKQDTPDGKGVFYYTYNGVTSATFPVEVVGKQEGQLIVKTATGPYKIRFSKDIVTPTKIASDTVVYPASAKFIKLPSKMDGTPTFTNKELIEANRLDMGYDESGFRFSGPYFADLNIDKAPEKVASCILLGLGATVEESEDLIKKAQILKSVSIYPSVKINMKPDTTAEVKHVRSKVAEALRVDLIKEAAIIQKYVEQDKDKMEGYFKTAAKEDSVDQLPDKLLSLNFVNDENLATFIEQLPELKKTASTLASLLLASRLGMTSLPEQAITGSIINLNKVITGLSTLKSGYNYV